MHRIACAIVVLVAASTQSRVGAEEPGLSLHVADVEEQAHVPTQYTCMGDGASPRITWSGVPEGTRSLALVVDDPDAPRGTFTHWLVYDIPPDARSIDPARPKQDRLPDGAKQGENDYHRVGWDGPCPPPGRAHRYRFTLYALDGELGVPPRADRRSIERAIRGHVLAEDTVTLRFAR